LDGADIAMPVLWVLKDRQPNGAHVEVSLRRVIVGNEVALADESDGGFATHLKGKFSDAQSLLQRFSDAGLEPDQAAWMQQSVCVVFDQMLAGVRQLPALVRLFAPKGKIEIYGANTVFFQPQYISGNFTLKIHANSLLDGTDNVFIRLIAQHLDYPFAPGERRFSTSRLFDLCFSAEKVIAPNGLAASIDAQLQMRGIYQPDRHEMNEKDHVSALLDGKSAAITTSYLRVLQRERFAAMVVALYAQPKQILKAPLLNSYKQAIEVALLVHAKNEFKDYPPKAMDDIAQAIHVPLAVMFNKAGKHDRPSNTG
jgi:hypothetical protein